MKIMQLAYKLALESRILQKQDVPIAAIITDLEDNIISSAVNNVEESKNTTHHAEMLAIAEAHKNLNMKFLQNCNIYVTIEPCPMCAYAISLARIKNIFIGAQNQKTGAILNGIKIFHSSVTALHKPNIYYGILDGEISELMKSFFTNLR